MKKILFIILIIGISVSFWLFKDKIIFQSSRAPAERQLKIITVYQKIKVEGEFATVEMQDGQTALDLLQKTAKIEVQGNGTEAFIQSISGQSATADKKEYWAFYVNGKPATVGAGSYKLQNGDKIEWKIENY